MVCFYSYRSTYGEGVTKKYHMRPRWGSGPHVQYIAYLVEALCPARNQLTKWTGKIDPSLWPELVYKCKAGSLRQVAQEYGVSHEAIRKVLNAASLK